jgi:hypothetical protein
VAKDEVNLVAIGYCYGCKTTLFLGMMENAGDTSEGDSYKMKYTDNYGNICTQYTDHPEVVSKFFSSSNIIDTHVIHHQNLLQLKKHGGQKSLLLSFNYTYWNVCHQYFLTTR